VKVLPRDTKRFSVPTHHFESLHAYYQSVALEGISTIIYGGRPLDLLVENRGARTTVVFFHAALGAAVTSTPVFSGRGITADIDANIICVSDPSLHLGLELAWFAGNSAQPLQWDLGNVLRHALTAVPSGQHIVFFGASGGGFAAMFYSHQFPASVAIAVNPQTDINAYTPHFVREYAQAAWDVEDIGCAPIQSNLADVNARGFPNSVALIQNVQDGHHRDRHAARWMRAVPTGHDRLGVMVEPWGQGHVVPPATLIRSTVAGLASAEGSWAPAMRELGFTVAPPSDYPARQMRAWAAQRNA